MKRLILLPSYFILTPAFIFLTIFYFLFLVRNSDIRHGLLTQDSNSKVSFAALPTSENVFTSNIIFNDIRTETVRQFFARYKSPLESYSQNIIENADKYSFDYRLLPAIAMQESNLCKKIIVDSYNCWGFGIYGKKVTRFESFPEAIATVSKTLANNYIAGGLDTAEEIMKKYTPSNNGSWASSVNYFMDQLQ